MYKSKLRLLLAKNKEAETMFEIISDFESSQLLGGCGNLKKCGFFSGDCGVFKDFNCGTYTKSVANEEFEINP